MQPFLQSWSRRKLLKAVATATQGAAISSAFGAALDESSFFDKSGAEYLHVKPGSFPMGEGRRIPLSMCEPLAYMTRNELQAMFPHGDPARFVLSDVLFQDGDSDEKPVELTRITRPFYLAATQVTNREYERFAPEHRKIRGKFSFSKADDEAVIYVSWHEAEAYCQWLAKEEGKPFRLPTEAEWEYAARAGTASLFSTGDTLPDYFVKNAQVTDFTSQKEKVSLKVGMTPPNPWGLYDMHGNVEEWVSDWYATYKGDRAAGGPSQGLFKVTRGGSHGTWAWYLRSANRSAALPETRGFTIGFRVACGELPESPAHADAPIEVLRHDIKQRTLAQVKRGPDPSTPYFKGPRMFVKIPSNAKGPLYHYHNHDTGLAECPNGDMLAIWYSCAREQGRELSVAASRLPFGSDEWEEAYLFYDTPDRNDHCPALSFDGDATLYHLNGTALSHFWEPLQVILRESKDSGVTWSKPRYIAPDFGLRNMVCQPIVILKNGWWIFGADAHPQSSAMWLSKDKGETWEDTGGSINGIHAAIIELKDGRLMALGRGNNVDGYLPMSISEDYGKTWRAQASELTPITTTERFSMTRLAEGHIALATFLPDVEHLGKQAKTDRELAKLCICISYDDGKTWPVRRILSNETQDRGVTGMSNGRVYLGPGNSEPTGYVTITQARNGLIHVVSSMNHYEFNLKWVESGSKNVSAMPIAKPLLSRTHLADVVSKAQMDTWRVARSMWSNERTGALDKLDIERGFSVEAMIEAMKNPGDEFILRAFIRSGCTMCNRYWIRVTSNSLSYWYAGEWKEIAKNNAPVAGTYRLSVREDTCVQIYCNRNLVATFPASYEIGFAPPTRGNWIEWESNLLAEEPHVQAISFDLEGSFAP